MKKKTSDDCNKHFDKKNPEEAETSEEEDKKPRYYTNQSETANKLSSTSHPSCESAYYTMQKRSHCTHRSSKSTRGYFAGVISMRD